MNIKKEIRYNDIITLESLERMAMDLGAYKPSKRYYSVYGFLLERFKKEGYKI